MSSVKNIALMAHVDAGKTTLTERILYHTGAIREQGSVDRGTAKTDDMEIERRRGISVRAALTSFSIDDTAVNLIDTPGHADFFSQAERAFLAADAVIVLVSATDGVQSGTELIVSEARACGVPMLFFISKCDRDAARIPVAMAQIKALHGGAFDYAHERYETAAMRDDAVLAAFLDGAEEDAALSDTLIAQGVAEGSLAPVACGSAFTGEGIDMLLSLIKKLVPSQPESAAAGSAAGVVFSVTHDRVFGRGAYIRLYSGVISARDVLEIRGVSHKISVIRGLSNGKWADKRELRAGDIALVYGLADCISGDIFGPCELLPPRAARGLSSKALLMVRVTPQNEADGTALAAALETLSAEDPALACAREPVRGGMQVCVMGAIQIEVLSALLPERFHIPVHIDEPAVIYKETIAREAIGFDAYTMPKPCWAVLKFRLSPAVRGSGVTYSCSVSPKRLGYRYRGQVEASIAPSLRQGPYGWEVTDVDIELIDGEDHPIHTHPLDFTIATPLALADGLRNAGTVLLEPILELRLSFDAGLLGRVTGDILRMRGEALPAVYHGSDVTLTAYVPLASSLNYAVDFASLTSGQGVMTKRLHGYKECPAELGATCPRRGVDPLDRSKYILAARNAMTGSIFE